MWQRKQGKIDYDPVGHKFRQTISQHPNQQPTTRNQPHSPQSLPHHANSSSTISPNILLFRNKPCLTNRSLLSSSLSLRQDLKVAQGLSAHIRALQFDGYCGIRYLIHQYTLRQLKGLEPANGVGWTGCI